MTEIVTLAKTEYERLRARDNELALLENAGVDNWEWYGDALNHPEDFE